MWGRLPWLQARANLIGLAVMDAWLLATSYNIAFHQASGRWAGLTGSITTTTLSWLSLSYLFGRYSANTESKRTTKFKVAIKTIFVAGMILGSIILGGWIFDYQDVRIERSFLVPVILSYTLISALLQILLRRRQESTRQWLVVGSQHEIDIIKLELAHSVNIINIDVTFQLDSITTQAVLLALPSNHGVAVSDSACLQDQAVEILLSKRSRGCEVQDLISWTELHLQRVPPEIFTPRWLVQAEGFKLQPNQIAWRLKRLGDLAFGTLLMFLTTPLLLAAAVAIRLEDGGPILYQQLRTGLYGQTFLIRKLRTMRVDAESSGPQWACAHDQRVTTVGRWLRRMRIDELPQLVNVIRGEMSLIGPRPERPEIEEQLEEVIPHYRIRHWIRPGLSGWAQVCHNYGASTADSRAKLSYDLYYLRNANIFLDVLILIKTIRLVALAHGSSPTQARDRSIHQL